ncbi:hypothetical protein BS78_K206700 [Paspalum vaginatum]|uniref:Uncharacterized protein n=1 Tax=Paspalum vaginatum TaxID=158149 RepID=A0A9W7X5V3_9POAL|nr:hypothetical protein BS78_K206700 [Paspalum vaginatum]
MAGAALLRSVARPSRLVVLEALRVHGRRHPGPVPCHHPLSIYSYSTGGPQTNTKKAHPLWDAAKAGLIEAAPVVSFFMAINCYLYFWANPVLDRMVDDLKAASMETSAMKDELTRISTRSDGITRNLQRLRGCLHLDGSETEARDIVGKFFVGQAIQTSGQDKEGGGHQAS